MSRKKPAAKKSVKKPSKKPSKKPGKKVAAKKARPAEKPAVSAKIRQKNYVVLGILAAWVIIFYIITMLRIGGH